MLMVNAGICLFVSLYFAATLYYPGGSQADAFSSGFSWSHNYWCNLLDKTSINGAINSARPVAISAMFILCLTLGVFWYWFPVFAGMGKNAIRIIRYAGIAAMLTNLFLFVGPHDIVINAASFFGIISLVGTLAGLHQNKWNALLYLGIFILFLVGVNNIFYYNKELLMYLPIIQKITFLFFLLWISLVSLRVSK